MSLIYMELVKLVDDYYKCDNETVRSQILGDIQLLTEAVCSVETVS